MPAAPFGLCDTCTHQQVNENTRGSRFSMCRLGLADPDWPKYPRMPVLSCPRHDPRPAGARSSQAEGPAAAMPR